jgi:acetate kinase
MSGLSSSMEDLLVDPAAVEAVEAFCYQARQHVAALTASIGGLDRLVFTGGIGANAPAVRAKICEGLEYLGITLDAELNADNDRVISADAGNVIVEAFATDEEVMIARHVGRVLAAKPLAAREA